MTEVMLWADPAVLAVGSCASNMQSAVEDLLEVGEVVRDWKVPVGFSANTLVALEAAGFFPLPQSLQTLFDREGIEHFAGADVARLVYSLLERLCAVEDILGLEDVLISSSSYDPLQTVSGPSTALDHTWLRLLDLVALGIAHDQLLTRRVLGSRSRAACPQLRVSGRLDIAELQEMGTDEEPVADPYCPCSYTEHLAIYSDTRSLLLDLLPTEVLMSSTGEDGIQTAISLCALQMASVGGMKPVLEDLRKFTLGSKFRQSLSDTKVLQDVGLADKVLRSCAEVLLGKKPGKTHDIRMSKSGNSPALRRGDSIAQRRDVDRELHLHYWAPTSNGVEFAAIVPHKVMTIPDLEAR